MEIQTEIKAAGRGGARPGAGRPSNTPAPKIFDVLGNAGTAVALSLGQKEFERQLAAERARADRGMFDVITDLIASLTATNSAAALSQISKDALKRRARLAAASWERLIAE